MQIVKLYKTQKGYFHSAEEAYKPKNRGKDTDPRSMSDLLPVTECFAIMDFPDGGTNPSTAQFFLLSSTSKIDVK